MILIQGLEKFKVTSFTALSDDEILNALKYIADLRSIELGQ